MKASTWTVLGAALAVLACAVPAAAAEGEGVSLTVYNQNFALVKDVRALDLVRGTQTVRINDVAASIDPTSVHIAALDHPGQVSVLEQNYQYDLADAQRLLSRYLDQEVTANLKEGGSRTGRLLSFDSGSLVLAQRDGGATVLTRAEVRDISLGTVPGGLVAKPTLVWDLDSRRQGTERAEVSYLTDNVTWHAEYVAVVNHQDTGLNLNGWVSLDNHSGATYKDAKLKLVAGDVHRVQQAVPMARKQIQPLAAAEFAPPQFQERGFFEYHIYTLQRPATVADRETKQLALFPAAEAGAKKVLVYDGMQNGAKVEVRMEFDNSKNNGLGMALPAGKVRVYKEDEDKALEFVGEDMIDHTPRDEKVRLTMGNAFDVVGERTRTDYRKLSDTSYEESWKIQVRNHKDAAVDVVVVEHLSGDWDIRRESAKFRKKDASTVEFPVSVAADDSVTVTYTARVKR